MKRTLIVLVVSFVALVAFAQVSSAQITQVSAQTQVSADVRPQHSVQPMGQLSFGRFYPGVAGGTITITPTNDRTFAGDLVLFNSFGWGPASFVLEGQAGQVFTYTIPTQVDLSNMPLGGTLQVTALTTDVASGSALDPMGQAWLNIGATLNVPAGVTYGYYSGTLPITVDFQ